MRVQWVNSKGSPAVLWFSTKMDGFKHLMRHAEKHESSVGMFKNATGTSMIFVKNGWAVTYDMTFKKISERHI